MTTRRQFVVAGALGALDAAFVRGSFAQPKPKVCMLGARPLEGSVFAGPIVQRLGELGYRDGSSMILAYRSTDGRLEREPVAVREVIDLKCDLIFSIAGERVERTVRDKRSATPVVFIASDYDPVAKGVVGDLRRPDRNMTGVYAPQAALVAKRLELMREVVPKGRRFLVLVDRYSQEHVGAAHKAAEVLGVQLTMVEFSTQPYDFSAAFETGRKAGAEGVLLLNSPVFGVNASTIAGLATKHRLPTIGGGFPVEAGLLLSYYADVVKAGRRAAEMGSRCCRGQSLPTLRSSRSTSFSS